MHVLRYTYMYTKHTYVEYMEQGTTEWFYDMYVW